jgi:hypothetical protein
MTQKNAENFSVYPRNYPRKSASINIVYMKKLALFCLFGLMIVFVFSAVLPVLAQGWQPPGETAQQMLTNVGTAAGIASETSLEFIVGTIINVALGLIGIIMVVLIIYGGYLWMTAAGDEKKVSKAKTILTDAVIGLVITLAAYAIARFVVQALVSATTAGG